MIRKIRRFLGLETVKEALIYGEDYELITIDMRTYPSFPWAITLPADEELLPILCNPPALDDYFFVLLDRFQSTVEWETRVLDLLGKKTP
jgi:hypothetical protein